MGEIRPGRVLTNGDARKPVRAMRRPVLERELAGICEMDVEHDAFRRCDQHLFDELLALVVAAVSTDELHAYAGQSYVENTRVRGVREVEAHDFTALRGQPEICLARDEHGVAESAHRDVRRLRLAEC